MNLREIAEQVAAANDIPAEIAYAQLALESTQGTSELAVNDHNYGGVKSTDGGFMHFDSDEAFVDYYSRFLGLFGVQGIRDVDTYIYTLANQPDGQNYIVGDDIPNYQNNLPSLMQEYLGGGGGSSSAPQDDGLSWDEIDWSKLAHNHGGEDEYSNLRNPDTGEKYTNTADLRSEAKHGLNLIGQWGDQHGLMPIVSGGAETWIHQSGEYSHHTGWKADVNIKGVTGDTKAGQEFKNFCNQNGFSAVWEGDHWDIDFSGNDTRDSGVQKGGSGFFSTYAPLAGDMGGRWAQTFPNRDEVNNEWHQAPESPDFWSTLGANLWDSISSTGAAYVAQSLWGNLAHSTRHFGRDPITQDDVNYVKNALPNDKDAQKFILLNGRSSEEIQWMVNQKLVDQKRREQVAQWRTANESKVAEALMSSAGFLGYMVDPLNLIPIGSAVKGVQIAERMGEGLANISKAAQIARYAAEQGAIAGSFATADGMMRELSSGEKVDYTSTAALGFLAGGVLGGAMGALARRSSIQNHIVSKADKLETTAIKMAADIAPEERLRIQNETYNEALKLHDTSYRDIARQHSGLYAKLENSGHVVAMKWDEAADLVKRLSGKELSKDAKAFHVPNEDYAVVLTDRIKPKDLDKVLAHESVHANLKSYIGESAYNRVIKTVTDNIHKEGTPYHMAAQKAGSTDPEEVLAHMMEDGTLPRDGKRNLWGVIKGGFKKVMRQEGSTVTLGAKDIEKLILHTLNASRVGDDIIHVNPDGTTTFAGMHYSNDNLVAPQRLAEWIELQDKIRDVTQANVPTKALKRVAQAMENSTLTATPFNFGVNSPSNTMRHITPELWKDAQGRGLGTLNSISAEEHKEYLEHALAKPYLNYCSERWKWYSKQLSLDPKTWSPKTAMAVYDRMAVDAYNDRYFFEMYGKHLENAIADIPPEVQKGVEYLRELREKQIELGRTSSKYVGSTKRNMVDDWWYETDPEIWRNVDTDKVNEFLSTFNVTERKANGELDINPADKARAFLKEYITEACHWDVIKAKIARDNIKKNLEIEASNAKRLEKNPDAEVRELLPTKPEEISDTEAQAWFDEHIDGAVDRIVRGYYDPLKAPEDGVQMSSLGTLSSFKTRVPFDTTHLKPRMVDGQEALFSFDNDLRHFNMDDMALKNIHRFAGEAATLAVFGSEKELKRFLGNIKAQLDTAAKDTRQVAYQQGMANKDYKTFVRQLNRLRGVRGEDEDALSRIGQIAHIARGAGYMKAGTNMGINQVAEMAGSIAYGGIGQLFHVVPPIGRFIDNLRHGKDTATLLRDLEDHMFGQTFESRIFTHSWEDSVIRDTLHKKGSRVDASLRFLADVTNNLSKITSAINALPKTTDGMVRGMRVQTIMDSLRVAHGDKIGGLRNPFSPEKLKAAHINPDEWEKIQKGLRTYSKKDGDKFIGFDWDKFQQEDPISAAKWYGLIQDQAERAIISGKKQGNSNILKNSGPIMQMLFQFKDYNLRAINAQTLRVLNSRELDDAVAACLSLLTNFGVYAGRAYATYLLMQASGMKDKAEEYYKRMFNNGQLERAAISRWSYASPASFGNDLYEAIYGAASTRTTVNRHPSSNSDDFNLSNALKTRSAGDIVGDIITQLPAVKEGLSVPRALLMGAQKAAGEDMTQRDLKQLLQLVPFQTFVPLNVYIQSLVNSSGLPEKRSK